MSTSPRALPDDVRDLEHDLGAARATQVEIDTLRQSIRELDDRRRELEQRFTELATTLIARGEAVGFSHQQLLNLLTDVPVRMARIGELHRATSLPLPAPLTPRLRPIHNGCAGVLALLDSCGIRRL